MKKLIYLITILILVGAGFYLWQNRHEYFFQGDDPYETYNDSNENEEGVVGDAVGGFNDKKTQEDDDGIEEISGTTEGDKNQELLDILQNHCGNRCENKKNTDDYDYCLEICGISNNENTQSSDCADLSSDFEKDVCYKNQAIKDRNSGTCNSISDNRLKENCKDRVIEELFN